MDTTIIPTLLAGDLAVRCTVLLLTSDPQASREGWEQAFGGAAVQLCKDTAALNAAMRAAATHYCLVWSDALQPPEGLLPQLVSRLEADPACLGISPLWRYAGANGRDHVSMAGLAVDGGGCLRVPHEGLPAAEASHADLLRCRLLPGQSLLLRRDAVLAQGGFAEQLDTLAGPDLCLRLAGAYGAGAFFAVTPRAQARLRDIFLPLRITEQWNSLAEAGRLPEAPRPDMADMCGDACAVNAWLMQGHADLVMAAPLPENAAWEEAYLAWRATGDAGRLAPLLAAMPADEAHTLRRLCRQFSSCLPHALEWYVARQADLVRCAGRSGQDGMQAALADWDAAAFRQQLLLPAMHALHMADVYECSLAQCAGLYPAWRELKDGPRRAPQAAPPQVGRPAPRPEDAACPPVAVLLPVRHAGPQELRASVDSLLAQQHACWQLCLVDDGASEATAAWLRQLPHEDSRIACRKSSGSGLAAALRTALDMSRAPWLLVLNEGDSLAPDALSAMARVVAGQPELRLVYADEDQVDGRGLARDPWFKTGFDRDLLEGGDVLGRPVLMARESVLACGGIARDGVDGAEAYDLLLRLTDSLEDRQVAQLPLVLYHRRADGPCARGHERGEAAAVRVLEAHGVRTGRTAEICPLGRGLFRLALPVPASPPAVSVVVLARPGVEPSSRLAEALEVLGRQWPCDVLWQPVEQSPEAVLPAPVAGWRALPPATSWAGGCNAAAEAAAGELLFFLDAALLPLPGCRPEQLLLQALRPGIGVVGGTVYREGRVWNAGLVPGAGGLPFAWLRGTARSDLARAGRGLLRISRPAIAAPMECLVVRRDLFRDRNGFNVNFGSLAGADFCLGAARRRLKTLMCAWEQWELTGDHLEDALAVAVQVAIQEGSGTQCGTLRAAESRENYIAYQQILQRFKDRWGDDIRRSPLRNPQLGASFDNDWRTPL